MRFWEMWYRMSFDGERCRYLPELWVSGDKLAMINDCVNQRLSVVRVDTCKQLSRQKKYEELKSGSVPGNFGFYEREKKEYRSVQL